MSSILYQEGINAFVVKLDSASEKTIAYVKTPCGTDGYKKMGIETFQKITENRNILRKENILYLVERGLMPVTMSRP